MKILNKDSVPVRIKGKKNRDERHQCEGRWRWNSKACENSSTYKYDLMTDGGWEEKKKKFSKKKKKKDGARTPAMVAAVAARA